MLCFISTFTGLWSSFEMRMKYVLSIGILICFSLHLGQAAVENNAGAGRGEPGDEGYPSHDRPQYAICKIETFWESLQCVKDLLPLVRNGFPWNLDHTGNQIRQQKKTGDLNDPPDPINHVSLLFDDFLRCLDQHAIPVECLLSSAIDTFKVDTVFTFICHIHPRSSDLLHSLQCLKDSRVLDVLVFYLADKSGAHVDDMAQGAVNASFRFLNNDELISMYQINPLVMGLVVRQGLICLPKSVISQDISFIINKKMGIRHCRPCAQFLPLLSDPFQERIEQDRFPYEYL